MRKLKNSELNRIDVSTFKSIKKTPLIIILDDIRSLNNIGSIFRTCDAFKIEKIYLCGITAKPPNRKITKTAIGATESVDWEYYEKIDDLISKLKSSGVKLWAIEQAEGSKSLSDLSIENPVIKHALIFGNEINGVNQNIVNNCDEVLEINQYGTKHSLNVSIAAGIVIWSFFKLLNN
jgi:tRNA G18 (ribose-2'-O)-methylase SpoU|tara:strand:+ start:2721 stop:3254 length:534 start_codon:yes stop_codon:yes gene_type:complete